MGLLILKIKKSDVSEKKVQNKSVSKETSVSYGPKTRLTSSVSELPSTKKEPLNEKQPPIKKEPIIDKAQPTKAANPSNSEPNRPIPKPSARPKRAPKVRHVDESLLTTKYAPRSLEDIVGNQNNIVGICRCVCSDCIVGCRCWNSE